MQDFSKWSLSSEVWRIDRQNIIEENDFIGFDVFDVKDISFAHQIAGIIYFFIFFTFYEARFRAITRRAMKISI
jgi:hypothetical protein